ncbi:BON domain-containing protein [Legionella tunisiensis]|uniref:BON domain-containing protein n=1 Tax=Legionella tunisiensis TaxID=1034944 RepID=UPI000594382B|nr:BON domain-containing protein [Legionella tunisiensis]
MLRIMREILLICSLLIMVACSATSTSESTGQYLDSAALTAKVKTELVDKLGAKGFTISVRTYKGEVQLSGIVSNLITKQRAAAIAANVDGVRRVRNSLLVE